MPVKRVAKSLKAVKEEEVKVEVKVEVVEQQKKLEHAEHHKIENLDEKTKDVVLKRLNGIF